MSLPVASSRVAASALPDSGEAKVAVNKTVKKKEVCLKYILKNLIDEHSETLLYRALTWIEDF